MFVCASAAESSLALAAVLWKECIIKRVIHSKERVLVRLKFACVHAAESSLAASSRDEQVCAARRELFEPRVKHSAALTLADCLGVLPSLVCVLAAESSLAASSRDEQVCAARRELFEPRVKHSAALTLSCCLVVLPPRSRCLVVLSSCRRVRAVLPHWHPATSCAIPSSLAARALCPRDRCTPMSSPPPRVLRPRA